MNSGTRSIGLMSHTSRTTSATRTPSVRRVREEVADEAQDVRHDAGRSRAARDVARPDQPERRSSSSQTPTSPRMTAPSELHRPSMRSRRLPELRPIGLG